jgi:acetyltransferase-like isoleucine patch superfamily enzyme
MARGTRVKYLSKKSPLMVVRYLVGTLLASVIGLKVILYPARVLLLRFGGVKIKNNSRIYDVSFINFYKSGFKNLKIGNNVFIGSETMIDLADVVSIGDDVTIAERVIFLTHTNVGYDDHPLKNRLPDIYEPVIIENGVFIGVGAVIMPGVTIGANSIVGAMSLVLKDVDAYTVVGGNPAKVIGAV